MGTLRDWITRHDEAFIQRCARTGMPFARVAIFVIFFWFGILKVLSLSPASPLVASLLERTLPFMGAGTFILLFGLFEVLIGILFLLRGAERLAILLLALHMATTVMPLILLPQIAWQAPFVPTLEGQYIIKNIAIIALAMGIAGHLRPMRQA